MNRANRPRRWERGVRTASGVTDVVLASVTGLLFACGEVVSGSEDERSEDVEARDGAIDIESSWRWMTFSSSTSSFPDMLSFFVSPNSFSFVPTYGDVVVPCLVVFGSRIRGSFSKSDML